MLSLTRITVVTLCLSFLALTASPIRSTAADWPMLGRSATHNPVVPHGKPPTEWDVETGKNIKWKAKLGSMTCGDPVVADGLVWVGTNNHFSDNFDYKNDAAVLACFRESDGKLLYKYTSPRLRTDRDMDWPYSSLASSPLMEGNHIWFVTNRWEVVCLDVGPLKRGEGEPRPVWKCDMVKQFAIHPNGGTMHWNRLPSVAAHGERIFVVTGNGAAPQYKPGDELLGVPAPRAPSLVCFEKQTGKIFWKDNSPGDNLLSVQWSTPLVAEIKGRVQCIVPQGDGWIRSFDAKTGELIWKFDMNPKESKWAPKRGGSRNNILAAPVLYENKIYIASGRMPSYHSGTGRLVCLDPTKSGDISSELAVNKDSKRLPHRRVRAVDPDKGEKAIPNANSGLIWEFVAEKGEGDEKLAFEQQMHRCAAGVAVHNGLVIAADAGGAVHCLDAETGKHYWGYDTLAVITAAPLIVRDRIYVADHDGDMAILGLSSDPVEAMRRTDSGFQPLAARTLGDSVWASPIYANETLYLATQSQFFAIAEDEPDQNNDDSKKQTGGYWPQWRGPNRDNVSTEAGLLKEWPDDGPPLCWQVDGLGTGIACLAIADGRILTLGYQDGQEFAIALEEQTGSLEWATVVGPAAKENRRMRWLAQRTPTIDGERAYVLAASGDLLCLDAADGKTLWRRSDVEDFGARTGPWGVADYPLVDGDRLVCAPCGKRATIVALDKKTGATIWETLVPDSNRRGFAAIVSSNGGGVRQYVVFTGETLVSVAAKDGQVLWNYDRVANRTGNSHTPIAWDEFVFASSGYGQGAALLKLTPDQGGVAAKTVHSYKGYFNIFADPNVRVGDHVYTCGRVLSCLDLKTGEVVWRERSTGPQPSSTWADGRLYVLHADGLVSLAEMSPEELLERGRFTLPDFKSALGATNPVVAGGRLYLRDDDRLFCYKVQSEGHADKPTRVELPKLASLAVEQDQRSKPERDRTLKSVFVPTPQDIVEKMLEVAKPRKNETLFDLGSGDGRILVTAAEKYGCRAVGYEIDGKLVEITRRKAEEQKLGERVKVHKKDLFTADLTNADVVMLYLLPPQTRKLIPRLRKDLKPGSRIVCHLLALPGIEPTKVIKVKSSKSGQEHELYLYAVPLRPAS